MQITIDTTAPLFEADRKILQVLLGVGETTRVVQEPAKAPKPAPKPAAKPVEAEEPEEPEEDLLGTHLTIQDAVDAATTLVNSGQQAKVKAALKTVGADRVSNIAQAKVAAFIAALEG